MPTMERRIMKKRNSAFTLVELLVVIGIIALLISILLPALNRARQQAKVVACASNMRQIVMATLSYAADHKGFLPPRYDAAYAPFSILPGGNQEYMYTYITYSPSSGPATSLPSNIGSLMVGGYLGNPVNTTWLNQTNPVTGLPRFCDQTLVPVRFDPAVDVASLGFVEAGGSLTPQEGYVWSSSYLYNPHYAFTTSKGTWPGTGNAIGQTDAVSQFNRVSQFSQYRALVSDMIQQDGIVTHRSSTNYSWNLAFIDGHVSTVRDTFLWAIVNSPATALARWPSTSGSPLETVEDDLDILETEAAGKNTAITVADPNDKLFTAAGGYIRRLEGSNGAAPGDGTYPADSDHPQVPWR
jgi:prepilin-type N-terminal cleavage/methylation domain-containing protein